jgi:hypothetical protein
MRIYEQSLIYGNGKDSGLVKSAMEKAIADILQTEGKTHIV